MIRDEYKKLDLTVSPFPEFFLRNVCHDGKLSYKIKCVGLSVILYLIGVIASFQSGTLQEFLSYYPFVAMLIVGSGTLMALTGFFRKIDDGIFGLEEVICSDIKEVNTFIDDAQKGKKIFFASMF